MNDTRIDAKEFLSQAYRIDQRINAKLEQVAHLRALARRITVSYGQEAVDRTRNVGSMEDTIHKIIMAEKDVDAKIDLLLAKKAEIEGVIRLVADPNARLLLELRYLSFRSWREIAAAMNYSPSNVYRLHNQALMLVETALATREVRCDGCTR